MRNEKLRENDKKRLGYVKKRASSFRYAFQGIKWLITTQPNFVIHIIATFVVILAGFYFKISAMEWLALILTIALVWITEAFNTAVEFLVDLISPEYNPLAGKIKDITAAAVLLAAIMAVIVGAIIFLPKIFP